MSPEQIVAGLRSLSATVPEGMYGRPGPLDDKTLRWLGKLYALGTALGETSDALTIRRAQHTLGSLAKQSASETILGALYRLLAIAEADLPFVEQGSFIPAGNGFDALQSFANIAHLAESKIMLVDPYMNESALLYFGAIVPAEVQLCLLTDRAHVQPGLAPAVSAWKHQFKDARPLEARVAPKKSLHDRLIIVNDLYAWSVSQSIKDFAVRSPASILKAEESVAALKIEAYTKMWDAAELLS